MNKKVVKTAMIRARTEPWKKKQAEEILGKLGVNPSEAINIFYSQIILKKAIPFSIDLEVEDTLKNYTKVESESELKELLDL